MPPTTAASDRVFEVGGLLTPCRKRGCIRQPVESVVHLNRIEGERIMRNHRAAGSSAGRNRRAGAGIASPTADPCLIT